MFPILAFPYTHIPLILPFLRHWFWFVCVLRGSSVCLNEDSVQVFQHSYFWFMIWQKNAIGHLFLIWMETLCLKAAMTKRSLLATSKQAGLVEYPATIISSLKTTKLAVCLCTKVPLQIMSDWNIPDTSVELPG